MIDELITVDSKCIIIFLLLRLMCSCVLCLLSVIGNDSCILLGLQFDSLDTLYKILIIAILICMIIVEIIRIYIGYVGNLSEKVMLWLM